PLLDSVDLRAFEAPMDIDAAVVAGVLLNQAPRGEEDQPRFVARLCVEVEREGLEHLVDVLCELYLNPDGIPATAQRVELGNPEKREELLWVDRGAHDSKQVPRPGFLLLGEGQTQLQLGGHLVAFVEVDRRIEDGVLRKHPEQDTVSDYLDSAADIDLGVLRDDRQLLLYFWVERLERVEQGVARGPRRLADYDLPVPVVRLELVNRGHGALSRPDVADNYEVVREIYGVEYGEDREIWPCPIPSRLVCLTFSRRGLRPDRRRYVRFFARH